jgi:hypothetical protein
MSCNTNCGPLVVTLLTGAPGRPANLGDITGDVSVVTTGNSSVATVTGIRGKTVAATTPTANQIYQFNGTEWQPVNFTAGTY